MSFRRCTAAVLTALLWGMMNSSLAVASPPPELSLTYRCDYLFLPPIGQATLQVVPQSDQLLQVRLEGQALGLAAWLDGERVQSYQSLLPCPLTPHATSRSHQRLTQINSRGRRIEYGWHWLFRADHPQVVAQRWWGGQLVEQQFHDRPLDAVSDFLALFVRFWQFGPQLQAGEQHVYPLFTPDGTIQVRITVEGLDAVRGIADQPLDLWRCRVWSDDGELTRGCSEVVLWCNDQRLPFKLQLSGLLGLGHITATIEMEE